MCFLIWDSALGVELSGWSPFANKCSNPRTPQLGNPNLGLGPTFKASLQKSHSVILDGDKTTVSSGWRGEYR